MRQKHVRHGRGSVRAYICGDLELPEFVNEVFGAEEVERLGSGSGQGLHVETRIGDSVIVIEAGPKPAHVTPWTNQIYVYVEDVDATYARAMAAGAASIEEPVDKPYEERAAGFTDSSGNTWYIATFTG
jgi:PhnB protein